MRSSVATCSVSDNVLQSAATAEGSGGDGTISRAEYDAWKARKKDKARDGNPSQP